MSLLTKLIDLFSTLVGGRKTTAPKVEVPKVEAPFDYAEASKKLSDGAKTFMTAGHSDSEKSSILKQIELNEKAGNTKYIVEVDTCYYKVYKGTFAGYRQGEWMLPVDGKMSKIMKDMVFLHQADEKDSMSKQIADNEAAGIGDYNIVFSDGHYIVKDNMIVANM